MPTPLIKRRLFRFGLRTLLAFVTFVAIASWIYSVGWPWWLAYREQARFERIASQFKAGISTDDVWTAIGGKAQLVAAYRPTADTEVRIVRFALINVYFVCLECPVDGTGSRWSAGTRVEVYRLPPVPTNYQTRRNESKDTHIYQTPGEWALQVYTEEFFDYYTGDRKDARGQKYERIHFDRLAMGKLY